MAPQTPHAPGSQAIKIPMYNTQENQASGRRRRSAANRLMKLERTESSDQGNASSIGSDSWNHTPASISKTQDMNHVQHAVASPSNMTSMSTPANSQRKDKHRADQNNSPPNNISAHFQSSQSPLGPSMLSSSAYKSINLNSHMSGDSDEPARLITYTKHSQGFTWNDELFLPSYMIGRHRYRGQGGSRRYRAGGTWDDGDDDDIGDFDEDGERCPVTDIFVTDEEAAAMMP